MGDFFPPSFFFFPVPFSLYDKVGIFLDLLIGRKGNDARARVGSQVLVVPKCFSRFVFAMVSFDSSDFF